MRKRNMLIISVSLLILSGLVISSFLVDSEKLAINIAERNDPPNLTHLFGTDWLGRDMLARTLKGLILSFVVGIGAAFLSTIFALILSLLSSWNKTIDYFVGFLIDLFLSVPHLITLILISFALGGGIKGVMIGITLTHWPSLTRLLRAEVLQAQTAEYVSVSKRLGKSRWWVARHHLLPHLMPQLLIGLILLFPHAILHEAAITFLGFGLSPEQPAIGIILAESMRYLSTGMWWLAFFPGISLVLIVGVFDLLGNTIRKHLDPFNI